MACSNPASRKQSLRTRYRAARQILEPDKRGELNRMIGRHLLARLGNQTGLSVGGYLAFDGEPDLEAALLELRSSGHRIALPVLERQETPSMCLRNWADDTPLRRNRFEILEPVDGQRIELAELDVLLIPLVAYDARGARLGLGGGYYDRLLSTGSANGKPLRVGVGYALQQAANLPLEDWDAPLHAILNEHGWFSFPL